MWLACNIVYHIKVLYDFLKNILSDPLPPQRVMPFTLDRLHRLLERDFSWSDDGSDAVSHAEPPSLTCAAYDQSTSNLFLGQSPAGHIIVLNLLDLGTHKPRLLGRHGGHVAGICLYPYTPVNLVASCSADNTVKIWTHDPKALHSTQPCLQTLYGHKAAVTCIAAVHDFLVSGGADGAVLLWKPSDSGLLAIPQFQLAATLWSSEHWVLGLTCQLQPSEAGAGQGVFVAVAHQPLLHLQFDKRAIRAAKDSSRVTQQDRCCCQVQFFGQADTVTAAAISSRDKPNPEAVPSSATERTRALQAAASSIRSSSRRGTSSPVSNAQKPLALGSVCSTAPSSIRRSQQQPAAAAVQSLSVFAVQFVAHELAVLTLAYDGYCRLMSAVDGGQLRCCWRHPDGTKYTAMDCTGAYGEVLLGDERGVLHVYSMNSEQLLASKQLTCSRIADIICCSSRTRSGCSSSNTSSSSSSQFIVLSQCAMELWQLRRGLSHGILPGGHKQAVIALQVCQASVQMDHGQLGSLGNPAAAPTTAAKASACSSASPGNHSSESGNGSSSSSSCCSLCAPYTVSTSSSASAAPGCMMLVSAGLDNRLLQWDLAGGPSVLASLAVGQGGAELSAMTFLQAWAILATGHENGQVWLWRLDTGTHTVLGPSGHTNTVSCLAPALTAKGDELLLSGSYDGCVSLWEPRHLRGVKPHLLARFDAFGLDPEALLEAYNLARLPDSTNSGSSSSSNPALFNAASVVRRSRRAITSAGRRSITPSTAGAAGSAAAGAERLVSIGSKSGSRSLSGGVTKSGLSSTGNSRPLSALEQQQQQHMLWNAQAGRSSGAAASGRWMGQMQQQQPGVQQCQGVPPLGVWQSAAGSSSCNGSPSQAAAAAAARGWTAAAGPPPLEAPEVLVVVFDAAQQLMVTAGNEGAIRVWSGSCAGELLGLHLGHTGPVNCLALDGNFLFSGSDDKTIRMWDVLPPHFASSRAGSSATLRRTGSAHGAVDYEAAVVGECEEGGGVGGRVIAAASERDTAAGFSCTSQLLPRQVGWLDDQISSSNNNSREGHDKHEAVIRSHCRTSTGGGGRLSHSIPHSIAFQVLHGHTAAVMGLEVVQASGLLVSCGRDGRLLQWDYTCGQLLAQQQLPGQELLCLAVRQDSSSQVYVGTSQAQVLSFGVADASILKSTVSL